MNRIYWLCYEIKWLLIRCLHFVSGRYYFISKKKYGKYKLLSSEEGNDYIAKKIREGRPFSCGRESFVEFDIVIKNRTREMFGINTFWMMGRFLKIFETEEDKISSYSGIQKYSAIIKNSLQHIDVLGVWNNLAMGDAYINSQNKKSEIVLISAGAVEPYSFDNPWSRELAGKKVLVVSPFYDSIMRQYNYNRDKIWNNEKVLPEFELKAIDSIWFLEPGQSGFADWFEAFDSLCERVLNEEFDIALLGCGTFGLPLAARICEAGKSAIQMGGGLQLLFGIKGSRWDNTLGKEYYNDFWIRPEDSSKPKNSEMLDGNCYW